MPSVNDFRSQLLGLARGTLFHVVITGAPVVSLNAALMRVTLKSASLPADKMGRIQCPYFGRHINYPGDRAYDTWETTLIGDHSWENYRAIANWHSKMNHPSGNVAVTTNALNFKADGNIYIYDQTDQRRLTMTLVGLMPLTLSEVSLDWGDNDKAIDLKVTWCFDWIQPVYS